MEDGQTVPIVPRGKNALGVHLVSAALFGMYLFFVGGVLGQIMHGG